MALAKTISGPDYITIGSKLWTDVQQVNGLTTTGEHTGADPGFPRLSNGELIALVLAWRRAAARSRTPTWSGWYELTIEALGWSQNGDRFQMTPEHAKAEADPAEVEVFWQSVGALTGQLDSARTVVKPLIIDYSYNSYEQAARDAWQKMKSENAAILPPIPDKPPESPIKPEPPATGPAQGEGGGGILIALLIVWALSKNKNKHQR